MIAIAFYAAALAGSYDCTIARQAVIGEGGADNSEVSFPESDRDAWRFSVRVPAGEAPRVTVDWPANPIQIAGTHRSFAIAPGQVAFVANSTGPCTFTEQACAAIVSLSARDDDNIAFSILPAGSSRDEAGTRSLIHVVFLGTCRRRSGADGR